MMIVAESEKVLVELNGEFVLVESKELQAEVWKSLDYLWPSLSHSFSHSFA